MNKFYNDVIVPRAKARAAANKAADFTVAAKAKLTKAIEAFIAKPRKASGELSKGQKKAQRALKNRDFITMEAVLAKVVG